MYNKRLHPRPCWRTDIVLSRVTVVRGRNTYEIIFFVVGDKGISNRAHKDSQVAAFGEVTIEPHFMRAGNLVCLAFQECNYRS